MEEIIEKNSSNSMLCIYIPRPLVEASINLLDKSKSDFIQIYIVRYEDYDIDIPVFIHPKIGIIKWLYPVPPQSSGFILQNNQIHDDWVSFIYIGIKDNNVVNFLKNAISECIADIKIDEL